MELSGGGWRCAVESGGWYSLGEGLAVEVVAARGVLRGVWVELEVGWVEAMDGLTGGDWVSGRLLAGEARRRMVTGRAVGRVAELVDELERSWRSRLRCPMLKTARVQELVSRLLQQAEFEPPGGSVGERTLRGAEDLERIRRVAMHLEARLGEAHGLEQLARQFGLNAFKLKRGFREVYGEPVFGYLRRKRMERGMEMLLDGATVLEAADAVGYANPSHFARAFREVHGVAPSQVKRVGKAVAYGAAEGPSGT
jgi:AraC-like DNA-binding protein